MKIGMVSVTFRNEDIPTVFEYARRAGIEGVEWSVCEKHIAEGDLSRISLVRKLSDELGIEIFALGSYCYMYDFEESRRYLELARQLSAPIMRIWAGNKGSSVCSREEYDMIVCNAIKLSRFAEEYSINLCFEYHPNTLTDSPDEAIALVKRINRPNVGLYWQRQETLTFEENRAAFLKVQPYLLGNIHISNYDAEKGYGYLEDISDELRGYFEAERKNSRNLVVEFVKEAALESLVSDVKVLRRVTE